MDALTRSYYHLTAHWPRPLPRSSEDIAKIKDIFTQAFSLKDEHQVWYTVFSNMAAVKNTKSRVSYASLVTIARRLDINKLLQDHKTIESVQHLAKLKAELEMKLSEEAKAEPDHAADLPIILPSGTHYPKGDVYSVPDIEAGMDTVS